MSHAGWGGVWNLALAHLRAEPIQFQILVGLGAAFGVVMILEGLRASFLPGYRALPHDPYIRPAAKSESRKRLTAAKTATVEPPARVEPPPAPFRPREIAARPYSHKRVRLHVARQSPLRPRIQRISLGESDVSYFQPYQQNPAQSLAFTELEAPYSPIPPNMEAAEV